MKVVGRREKIKRQWTSAKAGFVKTYTSTCIHYTTKKNILIEYTL